MPAAEFIPSIRAPLTRLHISSGTRAYGALVENPALVITKKHRIVDDKEMNIRFLLSAPEDKKRR